MVLILRVWGPLVLLIVLIVNHLLVQHCPLLVITRIFLAIGTFLRGVHPLLLLLLLLFLHHHVGLSASAACCARFLGLRVWLGCAYLGTLLNSTIAYDLVVVLHDYVLSCGLKFAGAAPVPLMAA